MGNEEWGIGNGELGIGEMREMREMRGIINDK
jgi:hypothetical protein